MGTQTKTFKTWQDPKILKTISGTRAWLITGGAGFIGSNLVETLLRLNQKVVVLDNLSTGYRSNLEEVKDLVTRQQWKRFKFIEGDLCDFKTCTMAVRGIDLVLHQAALGSVPRSLKDPLASHASNVDGTLNLLWASQTAGIRRLIYASSSSVYGDSPRLPKNEKHVGNLLSPYAVTKKVCELYADVFHRCYGLETVGLRYFNVFGPRQSPNGPYAAVIPRWINSLLNGDPVTIFGDGKTSRDFCYVHNVVQANLLAASAPFSYKNSLVLNVAFHERTTLNQLFALIQNKLVAQGNKSSITQPSYESFRSGDIRHSLADISLAAKTIGYCPRYSVSQGLEECLDWYIQNAKLYAADN